MPPAFRGFGLDLVLSGTKASIVDSTASNINYKNKHQQHLNVYNIGTNVLGANSLAFTTTAPNVTKSIIFYFLLSLCDFEKK